MNMRPRTFSEALAHRRSYYALGSNSSTTEDVVHAVREVVRTVPSAFNSQSTRIVVLLGEEHTKFWNIVKETLRPLVPADGFVKTEAKINNSFAAGEGTVLYFEDMTVIRRLQDSFPLYRDNFPTWAQHTSAMHQLAIWTMLDDMGLGASLQHYNPLIDDEVRRTWQLPADWMLIAQMPFGTPLDTPAPRQVDDLSKRIQVFR